MRLLLPQQEIFRGLRCATILMAFFENFLGGEMLHGHVVNILPTLNVKVRLVINIRINPLRVKPATKRQPLFAWSKRVANSISERNPNTKDTCLSQARVEACVLFGANMPLFKDDQIMVWFPCDSFCPSLINSLDNLARDAHNPGTIRPSRIIYSSSITREVAHVSG